MLESFFCYLYCLETIELAFVFVPELELAVLVCGTSMQIISLTVRSFDTLASVDLTALEYNMSKLPSERSASNTSMHPLCCFVVCSPRLFKVRFIITSK